MKLFDKLCSLLRPSDTALPPHLKEGRRGEDAAVRYLKRHGYRIVCRNFVSGKNEIDIIAKTKTHYVFCEVKTRVQDFHAVSPFGTPGRAVDDDKKRHLIAAATTFYRRHKKEDMHFRFDVIEVYLTQAQKVSHIHHIESAFTR